MAESGDNEINRFDGSLNTDVRDYHLPDNAVTHARNATVGFGTGNYECEPGNRHCVNAPYDIIGFIYLYEDYWGVFSTDDFNHEIGIFRESTCEYTALRGDSSGEEGGGGGLPGEFNNVPCLNFNRNNLITGVARQNFDCSWSMYWSDGYRNPDRTLNISKPDVECDELKLIRPTQQPCVKLAKGPGGGNILNGSYYAIISYTINGQRVTDYMGLSNILSVFTHDSVNGALDVLITNLDFEHYDEFELVVVSIVNGQANAKRVGLYSTEQKQISLDIIAESLPSVPLQFLPFRTPHMESSASITEMYDRLMRVAPRGKFDFNYQPLANQIFARWTSNEFPANYYRNGGTKPSFMGDEVYPAFIRWLYDDGDVTPSFHIPGRAPIVVPGSINELAVVPGPYNPTYFFEVFNEAWQLSNAITPLDEGGYQIAEGQMGYWESDEQYPNKPAIWGNLAGQKIRHHKFPIRTQTAQCKMYSDTAISPISGPVIRVLGVKFFNIKPPVDNNGNLIKGIKGYEILIGNRKGNQSIIAKGIINNTFSYNAGHFEGGNIPAAYPNFPYNDLRPDPYISKTLGATDNLGTVNNLTPNDVVLKKLVTFHSPETTFRRPFLAAKELKLESVVTGTANINFLRPNKHPRHKLPTNAAYIISLLTGLGLAVVKLVGNRVRSFFNNPMSGTTGAAGGVGSLLTAALINSIVSKHLNNVHDDLQMDTVYNEYGDLVEAKDGTVQSIEAQERENLSDPNSGGFLSGVGKLLLEGGKKLSGLTGGVLNGMGKFMKLTGGTSLFSSMWSEGTDQTMTLMLNLSQWQQYALQQQSHCFYNEFKTGINPQVHSIVDSAYLGPTIQDFTNVRINNLYRASTVILKTAVDVSNPETIDPFVTDRSKQTLATIRAAKGNSYFHQYPERLIHSDWGKWTASSWYASLKVRLRNQYGQIGDIRQIPTGCVHHVNINYDSPTSNVFVTPSVFGGDIYITRYTEKNTMFFFYDWLYNQFDGAEYDYLQSRMLPYPSYWINTVLADRGDLARGISPNLGGSVSSLTGGQGSPPNSFTTSPWLPTAFRVLDRFGIDTWVQDPNFAMKSMFVVKGAYFYLFASGVRDFYVESAINVAYRDWGNEVIQRHYDESSYTDMYKMFDANPDVIKADNYYKYDFSLSVLDSPMGEASWGRMQPSYYDPVVAETCYVNHHKRIEWSLPQTSVEQIKDSWREFLANNYREFKSDVTTIKPIGQTGSIVTFKYDSPLIIQGMETLTTDGGTKLLIGDGGFLTQNQQALTNSDRPYQFGACRDLRSIVNTPAGVFWMSPDQGKIFSIDKGLLDIAMKDMNWWFANYLPYQLLKDFPNYPLTDNPVAGIGCQTVFDSENDIVYFSKRDFKLKPGSIFPPFSLVFDGTGFSLRMFGSHLGYLTLKDSTNFFEDVSWTISYDIRRKQWISAHDWHPDLMMPSKKTFLTAKRNGLWKHNDRCDLFCNYYDVDYPYEVEFMSNTVPNVNVTRSIEYYMEVFKYGANCFDRYMFLDENFDEAVIWNNEQCSGLLKMALQSFDNPFAELQYPQFNLSDVNIVYSKVESKYRINMFYDLTDDRGQFNNARRLIWETGGNGYVKSLNPLNLNYQKNVQEHKAFRGYLLNIFLRKRVCGEKNFMLLFSVNKNMKSPR